MPVFSSETKAFKATFFPRFKQKEEVLAFLSDPSIPVNTGHPFQSTKTGRKYIFVKRECADGHFEIEHVDITDVDPNRFMSTAQMSEIGGNVAQGMDVLKHRLGDIPEYTMKMVAPGDIFTVPLVEGRICTFTMTDQSHGTWFDKCLYRQKINRSHDGRDVLRVEVLSYNNKVIPGWRHSGDIRNGNYALHHVSPTKVDGKFVEGIVTGTPVGYQKTPLVKFVRQQPVWAVVDHDQKLIHLIPLPLEEVTLGTQSTAAHMMVARVVNTPDGGELQVRAPDVIRHVLGIDTGDTTNPRLIESVTEAIVDFELGMESAALAVVPPAPVQDPEDDRPSAREAAAVAAIQRASKKEDDDEEEDSPKVTILIQNGLGSQIDSSNYLPEGEATVLGFGTGFTKEVVTDCRNQIVLPVTSYALEGAACALGTKPDCAVPYFDHTTIVVVGTGGKAMTDANARLVSGDKATWLNAIFIVAADVPDPGSTDPMAAVEHMNELNVAAVNAMSGPCSTILVRYLRQDQPGAPEEPVYRFYRGMKLSPWPEMYNYGDKVPFYKELFSDVVAHHRSCPPAFPVQQSIHDKSVYWKGKMMSVEELMTEFLTYDYHTFWALRDSIIELFDQLKVVMDSKEIRDFITKLDKYLTSLIDQEVVPLKEQIKESYATDPSSFEGGQKEKDKLLKKLSADLKGMKKSLGKSIRFVADALSKLTSARGVTKNYQSIKAAARANAIKTNVADASSMTLIERLEYLTTICDTYMMIMLDEGSLKTGLEHTKHERLLKVLTDWDPAVPAALPLPFRQDDRTRALPSEVYEAVAEIAGGPNQTPASGKMNLSIPAHNQPPGLYDAVMGIPLVNRMVALADPGTLKWTDVCNEADMAWWRIWIRRTLADCFNRIVNVKASQLAFFLIHLFLCGMESISSGMMGPPDPTTFEGVEPEDLPTTIQGMRALEAHLFSTAASTQTTTNPIYQLCYPSGKLVLPKTDDEWWIYIRYMRVMPFIGRPLSVQDRIRHNFRQLVAKLVWNKVLDQAVTKMCTESKKEKKGPVEKNPEWLAYVHLVVEVIFQVVRGEVKMTKDLAGRLLALSPPKHILSRGTLMMTSFMYARQYLVGVYKGGDPEKGFLRTVAVALFSFVKHSGVVLGNKKDLRQQIAHAETPGKLRKIYDRLVIESSVKDKRGSEGYQQKLEEARAKGPQFPTVWRSYKTDPEAHSQRLQQVLMTDEMPELDLSEEEPGDPFGELAVPVSLRDIFSKMTGADSVVKALDKVDALTLKADGTIKSPDLSSPLGNIPICHLIMLAIKPEEGAGGRNPVLVYRELVQTMLSEYKDYDDAIAAGVNVLMP